MNYTENYQLSQWAASDRVLMSDFNNDNAKIDAAITGIQAQVTEKANQCDLNNLSSAVAEKATHSELDELTAVVAGKAAQSELTALAAEVAQKGNCRIETGSYTGTGTAGMLKETQLTLSARPLFIVIAGDYTMIVPGMVNSGKSIPVSSSSNGYNSFSWSGNTLSWYNYDSASYQLNTQGQIYQYYAVYTN